MPIAQREKPATDGFRAFHHQKIAGQPPPEPEQARAIFLGRLDSHRGLHNFRAVPRMLEKASRLFRPSRFSRGLSILAASLVLLLGVLSVSPALHDFCHADDARHDADCGHHCVITDFAAGEAWFTPPAMVTEPVRVVAHVQAPAPAGLSVAQVPHRLQPACGPPV